MRTDLGFGRHSLRATLVLVLGIFMAIFAIAPALTAQSTTTGKVQGTVTDQTGAVVPHADVLLVNTDTNATQSALSDASGGYLFASVTPGTYRLTIHMAGFRTASVTDLVVDVEKTNTVPVKLEVGGDKEVVEVTADAAAQLQTTDAQIGNVIETSNILRLPTLNRDAVGLMNLQPGVVAGGDGLNMRVSGAIDDQNTVTLDGIDITANLVAASTSIPTPADSVEEFRANVANPSANLMRGSGGQISLIGRRGSNTFHGALYEFLQNNDLNANTWDNNRAGLAKAIIHDNRYGGRLGGPIQKNKTFFFGNYEARRFDSTVGVTRTVPTATLRQGIIQIQNGSSIEQFNLKTASVCGTSGNAACDPRGLGLDPSVAAQWAEMPLPNLAGGDGLNTGSYFANVQVPTQTDYGVMRLDHVFNEKLTLNTSLTYFRSDALSSSQISIENGDPSSVRSSPQRVIVPTASLTWQMSPTLLNVFRLGWVRDTSQGNAQTPTTSAGLLKTPGSMTSAGPVALLVGSGVSSFIDSPIDMDTSRARYQAQWQQDRQLTDDLTKTWGKHQIQFGGQINSLPFTHVRADKVYGGTITSLTADIDGDQTYLSIPAADRPLACGGTVTANCIPSTQSTNWDRYYASILGLVDNVGVLSVRDKNLQPLPFGTNLYNNTNEWAFYYYAQDSWRIKPSLTLNFGLSYGWQTAPKETENRQIIQTYASNGQPVNGTEFMAAKQQAALAGQIYNPTFAWETVTAAHRPVYNTDFGDVAPRASLAWNPSAKTGMMGSLLGDHKTVIRGGFGMVYDRSLTVQGIEIPMLGIGFGSNIFQPAPLCNSTGAGGTGCTASAGSANPGLSSFRVGTDGTLPLPVASAAASPIIPAPGAEVYTVGVDPAMKVGRSYNFDFSIQRELPGNMIVELAYIGRMGRHLPEDVNLNSAPYMMVDTASGQSFAQAYDAVANALRAGKAVTAQPFFENQFPGLAKSQGAASATAFIVGKNSSFFSQGSVGQLFLNLDTYRRTLGLQAYDSDQAQVEYLRTYGGYSNYNAGVVTLTKRLSHGFTFSANYTYSKSLDNAVSNQNSASGYSNSFNTATNYGPTSYDRRHVINAYYQYDLPAGKGHLVHGGKVIDQIIGGWYTSGIFTAWTGVPIYVTEGSQVWGGGTSITGAADYMVPVKGLPSTGLYQNVSNTTTCSNNFINGVVGSSVGGATGTNRDIFANPGAALCDFNYIQLATSGRTGRANPMRGLPFWNIDMRFGKTVPITERMKLGFSADFFNIFNHENFANPTINVTSPATFGVITATYTPPNRTNSARWIEMGLRLDF
jgi:hypothetical protein